MIGTASWLARVVDTFNTIDHALKAAPPQPAALYPPNPNQATSWISFPGWDRYYDRSNPNAQDDQRARMAVANPWVYSDVTAIANEASAAELVVKTRTGDKLEDIDNHPLELIWENPNEHMGRSYLISFWMWSYILASKAYLYWVPQGGKIVEVWPIPPFMITPIPDKDDFISGYAFKATSDAKPIPLPREYVTFSHSVNIFDIRDGLSFLVAAMIGIQTDQAAAEWNKNFFSEQNGIPDGAFLVPKDTNDTDLATIRMQIRAFFGGTKRGVGVYRAGDAKYEPWGRSQKDAEFLASRQFDQKAIDRTLGFPEGYWSERANRANAEQARDTMIAGAVWPVLVRLQEDLNAQTVKRWWGDDIRVEFKDIRPEDRELKLKEGEYHKSHWLLNELREADGKEPLPDDDPRGTMLVAEIAKGTPIPVTPASQATEAYLSEQEAQADAEAPDQEAAPMDEASAAEAPIEETPVPEAPLDPAHPLKALPDSRLGDLARWERKAIKYWKLGKVAPFESNAIPEAEHARITTALKAAQTAQDVRDAFKASDTLDDVWSDATALAAKAVE